MMRSEAIPPINWDLLSPHADGSLTPSDGFGTSGAFEGILQSAMAPRSSSSEDGRAQHAAFAKLWAQQVLAETRRMLFSTMFGGQNAGGDQASSPYSRMMNLLALSSRLADRDDTQANPYASFRPGKDVDAIVAHAARRFGLPEKLIHAVIKTESNYNPQARSPVGAQGLMQLMPGTARLMGVRDAGDPFENIMGGSRYLRDMLRRFDGNLRSALAAYNWGPHNVAEKGTDRLPDETRNYIARIRSLLKGEVEF